MAQTDLLDVVVVNHLSSKLTINLVKNVLTSRNVQSVTVVDNSESSEETQKLRAFCKKPKVSLVISQNAGFGAACNLGAQKGEAPYLAFLNPDLELFQGATLFSLLLKHLKHENAALVAPQLVDQSNLTLHTAGRFAPLNFWFWRYLFLYTQPLEKVPRRSTPVDYVTGAFMLFRRSIFEELEGFDERFFMYFEDLDLCYRLRKRGERLIYVPQLSVRHLAHQSVRKVSASKQANWYQESRRKFLTKYRGAFVANVHQWLKHP